MDHGMYVCVFPVLLQELEWDTNPHQTSVGLQNMIKHTPTTQYIVAMMDE